MQKKVAIEKNLINVAQYFESQGYQVDTIDDIQIDTVGGISNYNAIIIAGGNKDFMGVEETNTKVPIINAEGKTPTEIFERVDR